MSDVASAGRHGISRIRMAQMLDGLKRFRAEVLRVMSKFSQCGVDPRQHTRSRPMRLNLGRPFSHGVLSRGLNERSIVMLAIKVPKSVVW
jgi:hypothetical protein